MDSDTDAEMWAIYKFCLPLSLCTTENTMDLVCNICQKEVSEWVVV